MARPRPRQTSASDDDSSDLCAIDWRRRCRVCNSPSDGAHFGVDSCRACSAFFRRSVLERRKYSVCRSGSGECDLVNSTTRLCRKCRFVACLRVGMAPESIQPRSSKWTHDNPSSASSTEESEPSHGPSPSAPSPPFNNDHALLTKIADNLALMVERRRVCEFEVCPPPETVYDVNGNKIRELNFEKFSSIMEASAPIIADFCTSTFPDFDALAPDDKFLIFRDFMPVLHQIERHYYTVQNIGVGHDERHITITAFVNSHTKWKEFSSDANGIAQQALFDMVRRRAMDMEMLLLRSSFRRVNLDAIEYASLVSLLLWSPRRNSIPDSIYALSIRTRQRLLKALHSYYRYSLGLEDYATRLGEMMMLLVNVQASMKKHWEEIALLLVFNVFEEGTYMYNLLKR